MLLVDAHLLFLDAVLSFQNGALKKDWVRSVGKTLWILARMISNSPRSMISSHLDIPQRAYGD